MTRLYHYLTALFVLMAVAGCSDETIPSAVDDKLWNCDNNMDRNRAPGDDFFMYCNGGWYSRSELGNDHIIGLVYKEATDLISARVKNINDWRINKFDSEVASFQSGYDSADRFLQSRISQYSGMSAAEAAATFVKQGYDNFITCSLVPKDGYVYLYLTLSPDFIKASNLDQNTSPVRSFRYLAEHAEAYEMASRQSSVAGTRAQGESGGFLTTILSQLGVNPSYVIVDSEILPYFDNQIMWTWESMYRDYIPSVIERDYMFVSQEAINAYNMKYATAHTIGSLSEEVKGEYMRYIKSYAYATQHVSPLLKAEYLAICEEMRDAFRIRIKAQKWMSATTRERALDKLDKMKFNVGYPDRWIREGLANLDGGSLAEDVTQLREAKFQLVKNLAGYTCADFGLHAFIFDEESADRRNPADLTINNASYLAVGNCVNIAPAFLLEPYYDSRNSDALTYAMFAVIGHEMTHGFDAEGANYDEKGCLRNWWTVADRMDFDALLEQLVYSYSHLEVLPDELPGYYNPGEQTLAENIADLGGFKIARDAYVSKLNKEGYNGEELLRQERRFFQGYAELWRSKYDAYWVNFALVKNRDGHSLPRERVNGVVMNIDGWYDLFDVTRENTLFLPKDKRTYLW